MAERTTNEFITLLRNMNTQYQSAIDAGVDAVTAKDEVEAALISALAIYGSIEAVQTAETNAETSATNSQLRTWEAEAETMTIESYANEAEDVFVNEYTSDGDGTFTATPTTNYSLLHWAAKAAAFNPALYATLAGAAFTGGVTGTTLGLSGLLSGVNANFTGQVKGITPVAAEDLARKDYIDEKFDNWGLSIPETKNYMINGDFQIAQSGQINTQNQYGGYGGFLDGYSLFTNNLGITAEQIDIADLTDFTKGIKVTNSSAVATSNRVINNIYGMGGAGGRQAELLELSGNSATLSMWVWADTARTVTVNLSIPTDTNGDILSVRGIEETIDVALLANTWTKIVLTDTVVDATVETKGYQAELELGSIGLTEVIKTTGWQLELGTEATDYDKLGFNENLIRCMTLLEKSAPYGTDIYNTTTDDAVVDISGGVSTGLSLCKIKFKTKKISNDDTNYLQIYLMAPGGANVGKIQSITAAAERYTNDFSWLDLTNDSRPMAFVEYADSLALSPGDLYSFHYMVMCKPLVATVTVP